MVYLLILSTSYSLSQLAMSIQLSPVLLLQPGCQNTSQRGSTCGDIWRQILTFFSCVLRHSGQCGPRGIEFACHWCPKMYRNFVYYRFSGTVPQPWFWFTLSVHCACYPYVLSQPNSTSTHVESDKVIGLTDPLKLFGHFHATQYLILLCNLILTQQDEI